LEGIFSSFISGIKERAYAIAVECNEEALRELAPAIEQSFKEIYDTAVQEWYAAYSPKFYSRRGSLNNMADFIVDTDAFKATVGFFRSRMGKDRKNGDLSEKVFEQGWHGGANYNGTPHYRRPVPIEAGGDYDGRGWFRWGREAVRTPSPLMLFDEQFDTLCEEWRGKIGALTLEKYQARKSEIFGGR